MDGIKYQRSGEEAYYTQELFVEKEFSWHLNKMMESQKSVYDYVICDSQNEAKFAQELEASSAVKVYAKLPEWFQVPTPLGPYHPDWAVLIENVASERLYFVAETKGSSDLDNLRRKELAKVECGKVHFATLNQSQGETCRGIG